MSILSLSPTGIVLLPRNDDGWCQLGAYMGLDSESRGSRSLALRLQPALKSR